MKLIQEAARREGSVSQSVPGSRTDAPDDNPYPVRALAAQLPSIGDQGYALGE
jgi:hypothetical protein